MAASVRYASQSRRCGSATEISLRGGGFVNTQISAYYNVVTPDFGANWQIRAQVQLMFPK